MKLLLLLLAVLFEKEFPAVLLLLYEEEENELYEGEVEVLIKLVKALTLPTTVFAIFIEAFDEDLFLVVLLLLLFANCKLFELFNEFKLFDNFDCLSLNGFIFKPCEDKYLINVSL